MTEPDPDIERGFDQVHNHLGILNELGCPIGRDSRVLDFGCGEGNTVYAFRKLGYSAYGTDVKSPESDIRPRLEQEGLTSPDEEAVRLINPEHYEIPFESDFFDFVVSNAVFEHVQDYPRALSEIRRVLKPRGKSLHIIPTRYRIVEPHTFVPFATICRNRSYLLFWAWVGVRRERQRGFSAHEVARDNSEYLRTNTNYPTKRELIRYINAQFVDLRFVEQHFWKHSTGSANMLYRHLTRIGLRKAVPPLASLLRYVTAWVVFFVKE
jgi:SAM-dependent methyltransferase